MSDFVCQDRIELLVIELFKHPGGKKNTGTEKTIGDRQGRGGRAQKNLKRPATYPLGEFIDSLLECTISVCASLRHRLEKRNMAENTQPQGSKHQKPSAQENTAIKPNEPAWKQPRTEGEEERMKTSNP